MLAPKTQARVGRIMDALARVMAFGGGAILLALSAVTLVSVIGRSGTALGLSPVTGDFELVEAGLAIAVFSFLPYAQLTRGHVAVDLLARALPDRANAALGMLGDVLVTLAAGAVTWRLYLGFGEKFPFLEKGLRDKLQMGYKPFFPETTYELQLPVWIPYGLALLGAVLFTLVSLFTIWRSLNWTLQGAEESV